jgi:hypothetical protein
MPAIFDIDVFFFLDFMISVTLFRIPSLVGMIALVKSQLPPSQVAGGGIILALGW